MADLTLTLATLKGRTEALKEAKTAIDAAGAALASLQVKAASETAATVQALNGQDTVGFYSSVDQLLRQERFAGKAASVDFIKANPTCTEAEAIAAWDAAGKLATGLPVLLQDTGNLAIVYRSNLHSLGLVPDASWESQRAWIVATPKETIMGS